MSGLIPLLLVIILLVMVVIVVMFITGRKKNGGDSGTARQRKGRDVSLKEATKRLAQNPRDPEGLLAMGEIYYNDGAWDSALKTYETLAELGPVPHVNAFEVNLRIGLSALKLELTDQAYKGFSTAWTLKADSFEVNFNLGALEFQRNNYEKAIQLLQEARKQDPEHAPTLRLLGHSFFKIKKYKEAMAFIRKAIDLAPDDKESLYTLAECYAEANQTEQALKIFSHLRPDPAMGAAACLQSGILNTELRNTGKAIEDFEIGLKHSNIKGDVAIDMKYRLAAAYLTRNEIGKALVYLREIQSQNPTYKDVPAQIAKYQELNANKNLQVFLLAPQEEFVALCRKIVMGYFDRAKIKLTSIAVNKNEWADILAEVSTSKWSDLVMFRFIRTPGAIGELILRDFHSHVKDVKAGKGICVTLGNYTEEAKRFTEARLIDLIEKEQLSVILNTVDSTSPAAPPPVVEV